MKAIKYVLLMIIISAGITVQSCNSQQESQSADSQKQTKDAEKGLSQLDLNNARNKANYQIDGSRQNVITDVVKNCKNAIVGINVIQVQKVKYTDPFEMFFDDPMFRRYFGGREGGSRYREYEIRGLGSGFLISSNGYIITNHHVAGDATKVIVTTTDGKKHDAEIIGSDRVSDVTLLKIAGDNFPFLKLAQTNEIITGEWVIAFGNPFGLFDRNAKPTVTVGVISNSGLNFFQEGRVYKNMIQTDAAISSGNSGGPLLNALGEVIGVNTMIFSTAQSRQGAGSIGIGWAIPVDRVKSVIELIKKNKEINRDFSTGIEIRAIDEKIAKYLGISTAEGIVIVAVERNSEADKAGIMPGDIILDINDNKILTEEDYYINIFDNIKGDKVNIKVLRDEKEKEFSFKLL